MKTSSAIVLILASTALLAGCDSARQALTQTKAAPDEFSVYTRAPLTMPPDYGLRPPTDESAQQQEANSTRNRARRVLLGNNRTQVASIQAATPGTAALLARAGVQNADPGIRDIVDRETSAYAEEDQRFLEKLLYDNKDAATVVDPAAESKRIQENQALGKPITEGDTEMIETKPKAPLEGIFNGWFN